MSVKVVKEKRCKSQYTRVRVKENLDKNGDCVEMLMKRAGGRVSPFLGEVESANRSMRKQKARSGYGRGGR